MDPLTESDVRLLIKDEIRLHEEEVSQPKHVENKETMKEVKEELTNVRLDLKEMKATQKVVVQFAGAGILVWSVRQVVELVQSFHH